MDSKFRMVAKTFQGLEDVLCDELIGLGAENVEAGRRMVAFDGDLALMYKANLCCRTALRILKPIIKFNASTPDELYDCVRDIEWEKYMTVDSTFSIDSTVNSEDFNHSKYVTYRVKDGIADHFADRYGRRPSIRLKGADVQLNVHISDDRVTISLDSSGEPLSHRGYRVEQTAAPINEVLAAGIILKTGWHGECDFADPMCGSGTFLIEAAMIATNTNPGIYRDRFAFETWPDFDADLFENIYNDDSEERDCNCKILGGDIDPDAVAVARKNIKSARFEDVIDLTCRSMGDWKENGDDGVLVTNPPYGERLRPADIEFLYKNIGNWLKKEFQGWHAWILGYKDEHFDAIRLKPSVKYPILNGALECSLREYVLFDGRYDDFRAEGNHIKGEPKSTATPKPRHQSDREWQEESRKYDGHDAPRRDRKDRKSGERKYSKADARPAHKGDFKDDRRSDYKGRKGALKSKGADYKAIDQEPRISAEKEHRFHEHKMRSRNLWRHQKDIEATEE